MREQRELNVIRLLCPSWFVISYLKAYRQGKQIFVSQATNETDSSNRLRLVEALALGLVASKRPGLPGKQVPAKRLVDEAALWHTSKTKRHTPQSSRMSGERLVLSSKAGNQRQQQLRTASGFLAAVGCACVMVMAFDLVMRTQSVDELLAKSKIGAAEIKLAHIQSLNATGEGGDNYVKEGNAAGIATASIIVYVCGAVRLPVHPLLCMAPRLNFSNLPPWPMLNPSCFQALFCWKPK
jgi:hypothetical protein